MTEGRKQKADCSIHSLLQWRWRACLSFNETLSRFTALSKNGNQAAVYAFRLLLSITCSLSSAYAAEGTRPAYTPPPSAVSSGSIMQIIFSLLLVLAAIVLVAWLLKRMNVAQQGSGHLIKILGGISIGQRERVVLIEIKDTWLVVGVGPGQIRTLHTLQKAENSIPDPQPIETQPPENKFANLLSSVISHRKHGTGNK